MEAEGYRVLEHEWWHFNYTACDRQPILDIALETL
jgi:D-alanyl-D-alanine dipeptidase